MAKSFLRASKANGSTLRRVERIAAGFWKPSKRQRRAQLRQQGPQ
jgi:hypothetical protein